MYCSDQEYLKNTLLSVLVPMQRHEVEVPEFIPYNPEDENVIEERHQKVELDGAVFDVTITKDPYIIHLLDLEGKSTKSVINKAWYQKLLEKLNRTDDIDEIDDILCYGMDGEIWEYFPGEEDDDPYRFDYVDPSQYEVLPEYRTIMEEREEKFEQ